MSQSWIAFRLEPHRLVPITVTQINELKKTLKLRDDHARNPSFEHYEVIRTIVAMWDAEEQDIDG